MGRGDGHVSRCRTYITAGAVLAVALGLFASLPGDLRADAQQDRRTDSGLKLFRAMLQADVEIDRKTVDDRKILVLFFFTDDRRHATEVGRVFSGRQGGPDGIRGLPVLVETTSDSKFAEFEKRLPAGIFLTQAPDRKVLEAIIQFGIANRVIVYSPFEGHVESGVLGGLAIEAQVRPYLNQATLAASRISLKEFFLKVAKVHR